MPSPELTSFRRDWVLLNTAALLAGYVLYTPIAHGFTGGHASRQLTRAQMAAHSIALVVVAVLVAIAQRRALTGFVSVPWTRVIIAAIAFPAAFWIGYYQPWINGPDTDILAGFLVLGSAVWTGNVPAKRHPGAATIALVSFPVASVVAELCLLAAFTALQVTPALQTSELQHGVFWITIGGVTGILGGWIGGLAIARMLAGSVRARAA
jgi:hypothetical protein